jgi:hypothetical protein
MKRQFLFLCFVTAISTVSAQKDFRNTFYPEIGGNGLLYSVNYERNFNKGFVGRLGIGTANHAPTIPVMIGKIFLRRGFHPELSAGVTYGTHRSQSDIHGESYKKELWATFFIGYRYQEVGDRFFFHIGYTPFFGKRMIHSAGAGCGYRFNRL